MCLIFQRYKFKSKSQRLSLPAISHDRCVWYSKGTNLKANHNCRYGCLRLYAMCLIFQRYKFKSKSQLPHSMPCSWSRCVWYSKGTNLKANHNTTLAIPLAAEMCLIFQRYKFKSKSQPEPQRGPDVLRCVWYSKGTNLKANHNPLCLGIGLPHDVFDIPKVQI